MNLPAILRAEIVRRAEGGRDYLAQATGEERHRRIGRAANDIALWLRIANELGFTALPPIDVHRPIYQELDRLVAKEGLDLGEPLRDAADWHAARRSIDRTRARLRDILMGFEGAPAPDALNARWCDLRTIEFYFSIAEAAFHRRHAPEPGKDAA